MKICYVNHRFSADSLAVIEHANELIDDYASQGLALTLRQLYYRFVAADLIPNTERSYKRLGGIVNDARLAGLMDWEAIEDRGRNLVSLAHWNDASDIISAAASSFRLDKWEGQEHRVEVWVEKQALESVIGQAAEPLDCAYFACKGYTSQSEMWRAAQRFEGYHDHGQRPVILYLGDHDPSGIDMSRDVEDRLNDVFQIPVTVERIALNMDQVKKHRPPPNPAKISDSRAADYIKKFGHSSWELDALEPATLRKLITQSIKRWMDLDLFYEMQRKQEKMRELLEQASDRWSDVEEFLEGEL